MSLGLINDLKVKTHYLRYIFLSLILVILTSLLGDLKVLSNTLLYDILAFTSLAIFFATIAWSIYDANRKLKQSYVRTEKGNMEALNWIKFRNYIKDFTMLKEKDLDYVKLADNYLSYAISLREAKILKNILIRMKHTVTLYILI